MPRERSLLERLRDPRAESTRTTEEDPQRLAASVLENLRRLLNSHPGISASRMDYGIPEFADVAYSMPESQGRLRTAIKNAIEKFEPRLKRVSVSFVIDADEPLLLRFDVRADLVTSRQKAAVRFRTQIDPSGEVQVLD